jgi:hypothetical protein
LAVFVFGTCVACGFYVVMVLPYIYGKGALSRLIFQKKAKFLNIFMLILRLKMM